MVNTGSILDYSFLDYSRKFATLRATEVATNGPRTASKKQSNERSNCCFDWK